MLQGIKGEAPASARDNLVPTVDGNQTFGYSGHVTCGELIRRLKSAGFVERRTGKGSHRQFIHPRTRQVITVSVHTKKEVGRGLAARIVKEAGL